MEPYVAIGNDELGQPVRKGDKVVNHKLKLSGFLEHGTDGDTGRESTMLGFVSVDGEHYLVAINNQLAFGWEKCND